MAILSKIGQAWHFDSVSSQENGVHFSPADFKFCLFGLTMTTDSPKLLVFSITCGVVTISLLSSAARALLSTVFHKITSIFSKLLTPSVVPSVQSRVSIKMGQVHPGISTSIQLDTQSQADLFATYEIIDFPSPVIERWNLENPRRVEMKSIGVGTDIKTCDRACSPCFVNNLMESSTEDLLIFDDSGEVQDGSLISLEAGENPLSQESTELHEKFASIQLALDGFSEEMKEMNYTMTNLSVLSQRYYGVPLTASSDKSSTDSTFNSTGLIWEDEFDTFLTNPPCQTPTVCADFHQDMRPFESELDVFSTNLFLEENLREEEVEDGMNARDSGCGDIWDTESESILSSCPNCSSSSSSILNQHNDGRPLSAPSGTTSPSRSSLTSNKSPDRVPKRRVRRK